MSTGDDPRELPGRLAIMSAREIVLDGVEPLEPVPVPLAEVAGLVTAEPTLTPADVPPFDASAMDGFAVRSSDLASQEPGGGAGSTESAGSAGVELKISGEAGAGRPWAGTLQAGGAVSISTGAEVPRGADAVVKVEDTVRRGEAVLVASPVAPGQNIRRRGEAREAGSEVLPAGSRIGPVEVGLLASSGIDPVICRPRPTVAVVATGDELVDPGTATGPGQIWNSNLPVISAMARAAGAEVVSTATIGDTRAETEAALGKAMAADVVVICGGVSVGDHDHVKDSLRSLGAERKFWGLAMKPGRPAWFGTRGKARILGLPGNPVSTLAVFAVLGVPLLKALAGDSAASVIGRGRLLAPVERLSDRLLAVPCRLDSGSLESALDPITTRGSHDFISLAGTRALALVEAGTGSVAAGSEVGMIALEAQ
jgi:molybdopterin molybdotransferase